MESIFPESNKPKLNERNPQGMIKYHRLQKWWLNELTASERSRIRDQYTPLSGSKIDDGLYTNTTNSTVKFLTELGSWFSSKEGDRPLAEKIYKEAERNINVSTSVVDKHFLYGRMLELFYLNRNKGNYYELAKEYAVKQIDLASNVLKQMEQEHIRVISKTAQREGLSVLDFPFRAPSHSGYKQLAIVYKKEKRWDDVILLCEQAINQGWCGDWEKRVDEAIREKLKAKAPN